MTARRFAALGAGACLLVPAVARAQTYEESFGLPPSAQEPPPPPPPPAPEPPARPFGAPGQWVVTGASSVGVGSTTFSASKGSSLGVTFAPGLDRFVTRNFSVGVSLNLSFSDTHGYLPDGTLVENRSTTYSGGPRLGMNLPLSRQLSLYPRLVVGYVSTQTTAQAAPSSASVEHHGPWGQVDLPLLYQVRPYLFLAVVPSLTFDASSGHGNPDDGGPHTSAGVGFLLGGWFGGAEPQVEPAPAEDVPARLSRFGDAGTVVLDAELDGYGFATSYQGPSGASYDVFGVVAGVDYFIADHFSLGAILAARHSEAAGLEVLTGAGYTNHNTRVSFGLRPAVEIPLGRVLSLYPRATLGFASESYDIESGGSANKGTDDALYVDLYAPLLVHPARHFFFGLGPEVSTDLSRTVNPGNRSNQSTYVGAGLLVGGWL